MQPNGLKYKQQNKGRVRNITRAYNEHREKMSQRERKHD